MMSMIAAIFALGLQVAAPVDLDTIREKSGLPALGAAMVTSDRILWQGVSGVRRVGERAPVQLSDKWHLGSCGKAMTVYLLARLVAKGKLTWESTPRQVFGARLPATVTALADVPLHQFLTHRAGAPNQASIRRFDAAEGGPDQLEYRPPATRRPALRSRTKTGTPSFPTFARRHSSIRLLQSDSRVLDRPSRIKVDDALDGHRVQRATG
jgi:CubicO group peptidase (beta-lactamase class C family)